MAQSVCLVVAAGHRARLEAIVADRNRSRKHVARARLVLLSADRLDVATVARRAGVSRPAVWRWQRRYAEEGVDGLLRDKTRKPGKAPLGDDLVRRVVALTCAAPPGEVTHWTGRAMAAAAGVSLRSVQRIWAAHKLQPHRVRTFKRSRDPDFLAKLAAIVGLYMAPPRHAVVLSLDEKSQIQAHDPRLQAERDHDLVRGAQRPRRRGARPLHATAPPPGVPALPQHDRGGGAGRQAGPLHPRQLRHAQAPEGAGVAGAPPTLDLPLHPDLGLVAERGRELLLGANPEAAPARRLLLDRRAASGHPPLHRPAQRRSRALRLDQDRRPDHHQDKSSEYVSAVATT